MSRTMQRMTVNIALQAAAVAALGAITETTVDMTSSGNWEVTVAYGDTNLVAMAQSGTGRIVKKGGGCLLLRKNSTFTGGVEIQEGFVTVDPDSEAGTSGTVVCTALGAGAVTILGQRPGYTGYCELGVVGAGKGDARMVTVTNDIYVTGDTDGQYPALVLYGQNSVLTGKITADRDFHFWDDDVSCAAISSSQYNRYKYVVSCTFGEVEAAGTIGYRGFTRFQFAGKVTAPVMDLSISRTARAGEANPNRDVAHGAVEFFCAQNEIGKLVSGHTPVYCAAKDALPGALYRHDIKNSGYSANVLYNHAYGKSTCFDQSVGGFESDPIYDGQKEGSQTIEWAVEDGGSKTLTITGMPPEEGETARELVTCASFNGTMNLVIDAYDGFTQTVSNRAHALSGALHVKKGAFAVAGSATFPKLSGITVDEGAVFRHDSTNSAALPAVTSLSVAGSFIAGADVDPASLPTAALTEIRFASTAHVELPAGTVLTTKSLYVDGVKQACGTWTHAQYPFIPEGVSVRTTTGTSASGTAEWTGAASSDNLMSTMANWKGEPESLDFADYSLAVKIGGEGTEMVYEDGTRLHSIDFCRTPASTPFTIRPATPGAVLEVAGRIEMTNNAQLVLSGIISGPMRVDQGSAVSASEAIVYMPRIADPDVATYAEFNRVYGNNVNILPLVLDDATVEKPLWVTGSAIGYISVYCKPGTTNEVKGAFYISNKHSSLHVDEGAVVTFSGGVSYGSYTSKELPGTMIVRDRPIVSASYFSHRLGTLVMDAENFSLGGSSSGDGISVNPLADGTLLECRRSFCFNGDCMLDFRGSASYATVELHSTTQRLSRLSARATSPQSSIRGDAGSLLEVVGGYGNGRTGLDEALAPGVKLLTNCVDIAGALSVRMSATNETLTFFSKDFTTVGDLEVAAGTLDIRDTATWLNGTNVTVRGEGRLKIGRSRTFNPRIAALALSDDAVFEVPEGVSQKLSSVTTNGVALCAGEYTSLPNGDGDFLAGGGSLVVRSPGMTILVW